MGKRRDSLVACPACGHTNAPGAILCVDCNAPVADTGTLTTPPIDSQHPAVPSSSGSKNHIAVDESPTLDADVFEQDRPLSPGTGLARNRYEIQDVLGQGGMGTVYKVHDHELDRVVALKVIRPDLVSSPDILKRFKQEVLLAREVTHRNVVRIFDIGESDALKYITMEYVDGVSLSSLIDKKGKFDAPEAVSIIRQVLEGLAAAHAEGVTHRDLKPSNIMLDERGKAVVMDFGIAQSEQSAGLTRTGALVGTPEYMSPEQAKGQRVDQRSDIYSVGIILYELLTGRIPFKSETAVETMYKRTQEPAIPPAEIEHSVPRDANDIVVKCLEMDPEKRFQSTHELLQALETFDVITRVSPWTMLAGGLRRRSGGLKGAVLAAVIVLLALGIAIPVAQRTSNRTTARPTQAIQVLIADFASPPELEGTIEQLLGIALEGAAFIQNLDRGDARRTAREFQDGVTTLGEAAARTVAQREGADIVVTGSVESRADGYRVSARALQASTGEMISAETADAPNFEALKPAISAVAAAFRTALGDVTPEEGRFSEAETFTANSLGAMQRYARAQELRGNWEEAISYYRNAIELDPELGRAYSGLAAAYSNTGQPEEAGRYYRLALEHIDRMTDREKLRTRGAYYLFLKDDQQAIRELTELVERYPADSAAQNNLAIAHFLRRDMNSAQISGREFLRYYPRNVVAQYNLALYAMYAGDFETARREGQAALELDPGAYKAYLAIAVSELAQNRPEQAERAYREMEDLHVNGASLAAVGLADLAISKGRLREAVDILGEGITADLISNTGTPAQIKRALQASLYARLGQTDLAVRTADMAVLGSQYLGVLFRAAEVYVESGMLERATQIAETLSQRLEREPEVHAKLIEALVQLQMNRPREALRMLEESQQIADTWLGHFYMGQAYLAAGAYAQASSEFDVCWDRRGEATAVFLDDFPSYHLVSSLHYYLGRAEEGLNSPGAEDRYQTFLAIKEGLESPHARDAQERLLRLQSAVGQ